MMIVTTCCLIPACSSFQQQPSQLPRSTRLLLRQAQTDSSSLSSSQSLPPIDKYCRLVQESIDANEFVSFHLKGPSKKAGTVDELRGCLAQVQGRLIEKKKKKKSTITILLQATCKYHGATDIVKNFNIDQVETILQQLLLKKQQDDASLFQSEWGTTTWHHPSGSKLGLSHCTLTTSTKVSELNLKTLQIKSRKASTAAAVVTIAPHDRTKQLSVASHTAPFWKAIGLDKKPAKRRQCQKFVEIVGNLVQRKVSDITTTAEAAVKIQTVDMGCGRGYLTFSLHDYLRKQYSSTTAAANNIIETRGIDMRPKLVAEMNRIATTTTTLSDDDDDAMHGLKFETGTIESFLDASLLKDDDDDDAKDDHNERRLQILIALHACDTATDDALWSGIQSQADIIVVAPCCHKQVRPQLDQHYSSSNHPLADVLRHGIYRERMAETVTDSMRALLLELAQYQVKVFEFIGGEHTSKNVMITAVRRQRGISSKKEMEDTRQRLRALAQFHGIRVQKLATWMKEELVEGESVGGTPVVLSAKTMPPL